MADLSDGLAGIFASERGRREGTLLDEVRAVPGLGERLLRHVRGGSTWPARDDLDEVVLALGPAGVRQVAVQWALVQVIEASQLPEPLHSQLWLDAVCRATAARAIAWSAGRVSPDAGFTAGLALQVGSAELLRVKPAYAAWVRRVRPSSGREREEAERALFGRAAAEGFEAVAERWSLPDELVRPLREHWADEDSDDPLLVVLDWSDRLGAALTAAAAGDALGLWVKGVTRLLWCSEQQGWDLVRMVLAAVPAAAEALGVKAAPVPDLEDLRLRQGPRAEAAPLSEEELRVWSQLLERQVEQGTSSDGEPLPADTLTGLPTPITFRQVYDEEARAARAAGTPLWLLHLDIDRFSELNVQFGHTIGDRVLQQAVVVLRRVVPESYVGRVGPDSFGLLLEGDAFTARLTAERLRSAVEEMRLTVEGKPLRITASVYATDAARWVDEEAGHLACFEDLLRRPARDGGRNHVHWIGPEPTALRVASNKG